MVERISRFADIPEELLTELTEVEREIFRLNLRHRGSLTHGDRGRLAQRLNINRCDFSHFQARMFRKLGQQFVSMAARIKELEQQLDPPMPEELNYAEKQEFYLTDDTVMAGVDERHRRVWAMRMLKPGATYESIGKEFGLTGECIRQIVTKTERKIRQNMLTMRGKQQLFIGIIERLEAQILELQTSKQPAFYAVVPHWARQRVDELELSVRCLNILRNENIVYVGELVQKTEHALMLCPNCGRKSLQELKELLASMHLHFDMRLDGWPPADLPPKPQPPKPEPLWTMPEYKEYLQRQIDVRKQNVQLRSLILARQKDGQV